MEGNREFDLGRDRACDYGSELELHLLDEDYENAGSDLVKIWRKLGRPRYLGKGQWSAVAKTAQSRKNRG